MGGQASAGGCRCKAQRGDMPTGRTISMCFPTSTVSYRMQRSVTFSPTILRRAYSGWRTYDILGATWGQRESQTYTDSGCARWQHVDRLTSVGPHEVKSCKRRACKACLTQHYPVGTTVTDSFSRFLSREDTQLPFRLTGSATSPMRRLSTGIQPFWNAREAFQVARRLRTEARMRDPIQ